MEILDDQSAPEIQVTDKQDYTSFWNLLFANGLERFCYYGFRSIIILYVVDMGWEHSEALYNYGTMTMLVFGGALVGGLIGDFLIGTRQAILAGLASSALGCLLLCVPVVDLTYFGAGLIILGTCLYRPNVFSGVSKLFVRDPRGLGGHFALFYGFINVGAFLSGLVVGFVAETYGWTIGFLICAIGYLGAALIAYFSSIPETKVLTKTRTDRKPSAFGLVVIPIFFVGLYWFFYEYNYELLWGFEFDFTARLSFPEIGLHGSIWINSFIGIVGTVALFFWFRKRELNYLYLVAVGFLIYALAWFLMWMFGSLFRANGFIGFYLLFIILTSVAEIFVGAFILPVIGRHVPVGLLGTAFGFYGLILGLLNRATSLFSDSPGKIGMWACALIMLFGGSLMFILAPFFKRTKVDASEDTDLLE